MYWTCKINMFLLREIFPTSPKNWSYVECTVKLYAYQNIKIAKYLRARAK